MRDIIVTIIVGCLLPAILVRPYLGAYVWTWLALMNPHRLVWGFAESLPFGQAVAIATLISTPFSRKKASFPLTPLTVTYISFLLWMSLTSLFALNTREVVLERWVFVTKIHVMMFVILVLLRGRKQIETLIWVATLSLGFYGVKGGIFTVLTGGEYRVWGPRMSTVEGNNELAVGLVILIPFMVYLYRTSQSRLVRWLMLFSCVTCGLSILGSHSRGALLALIAMALFLGLKGRRRLLNTMMLTALLGIGVTLMPESWTARMETIVDYQQEESAASRIYVWKTIWTLAQDRPVVGAGFATNSAEVFRRYAPEGPEQFAESRWVAHSIYFQALGEHGFPGLALYLALGVLTWRSASRLARETLADPEFAAWVPPLMKSVQVSLLGFAVGGAFLALVHFDLPYYIAAYVVLVDATVRQRRRLRCDLEPQAMVVSASGVAK